MGDDWLVDENIDVDIRQLQDFAQHIREELETNFRPSFESGVAPMLRVQAPFGHGGLKEGEFFRGRHDESRSAATQMLGEAMRGLAALSMAAMSISAEYLTGDALAQATNESVYNAFSGADGQRTLDDPQQGDVDQQQGAIPEQAQDPGRYFGDGGGDPSTGATSDMYSEQVIREGQAGEYTIQGDDENMHDPALDPATPPSPEH